MKRLRALVAAFAAIAGTVPGAAQVASASTQANAMAGKMLAAGLAIGTLCLVILGYFTMAGHGDRQTLGLWAAGLIVILCAPAIAGLF